TLSMGTGGKLYADVWIDESVANASIVGLMYKSTFVWDTFELIKAAISANAAGLPTSQPIDLRRGPPVVGGGTSFEPIAAAQPKRYDGPNASTPYFGSIYGIASSEQA